MNVYTIIKELEQVIEKLKIKVMFLLSEKKELELKIYELKESIKKM
jgi:chaperonin cofactor prefoldin